jgi:hypothetical protein
MLGLKAALRTGTPVSALDPPHPHPAFGRHAVSQNEYPQVEGGYLVSTDVTKHPGGLYILQGLSQWNLETQHGTLTARCSLERR